MLWRQSLLVLAVTAGVAGWGFNQQEDPVSYRVSSELVLVELLARDSSGSFIRDLTAADVRVLEDGKPQKILVFDLVGKGRTPGEAAPRVHPEGVLSDDGPTFAAPPAAASIAVVIDLGSVQQMPLPRVRASVAEFTRTLMRPGDRMMLVTVGRRLRIVEPFTTDTGRILRALDQIEAPASVAEDTSLTGFMDEIESLFRLVSITSNREVLKDSAAGIGRNLLVTIENRLAQSSEAIGLLARHLATIPGRKHIVLYSAGYPLNAPMAVQDIIEQRISEGTRVDQSLRQHLSAVLGSAVRQEFSRYVEDIADEANRAQVSIYSIDARGLIARAAGGDAGARGLGHGSRKGTNAGFMSADITDPQDYLHGVSAATGGLAFFNSNDLKRGLVRAYDDLGEYYLIGYRPASRRRAGRYHKIRVEVDRDDVDLRHRTGYRDHDPEKRRETEVADALRVPSLFQGFPLDLETTFEEGRLQVYTFVPTSALAFETRGQRFVGSVEVFGLLVPTDGADPQDDLRFAKRYRWEINGDELKQLRAGDNVVSAGQIRAPAGDYQLVVAVRRGVDGLLATITRPVRID